MTGEQQALREFYQQLHQFVLEHHDDDGDEGDYNEGYSEDEGEDYELA
jgi:hypothetical protein